MTHWFRSSQAPLAHTSPAHRHVPLYREPYLQNEGPSIKLITTSHACGGQRSTSCLPRLFFTFYFYLVRWGLSPSKELVSSSRLVALQVQGSSCLHLASVSLNALFLYDTPDDLTINEQNLKKLFFIAGDTGVWCLAML